MDYNETLCQAVDILIQKRLKDLAFNTTQQFTVLDNTNRNKGEYRVGNSAIDFLAFGTLSYDVGDEVYVTIPNNDWSQQKFIIGPKSNQKKEKNWKLLAQFPPYTAENATFFSASQTLQTPMMIDNAAVRFEIKTALTDYWIKFRLFDSEENHCEVLLTSKDLFNVNNIFFSKQLVTFDNIFDFFPVHHIIMEINTRNKGLFLQHIQILTQTGNKNYSLPENIITLKQKVGEIITNEK